VRIDEFNNIGICGKFRVHFDGSEFNDVKTLIDAVAHQARLRFEIKAIEIKHLTKGGVERGRWMFCDKLILLAEKCYSFGYLLGQKMDEIFGVESKETDYINELRSSASVKGNVTP
jgi:hypothetical protein